METPAEFFHGSYTPGKRHSSDVKTSDHFIIDDLLNFPNDDTCDVIGDVVNPGTSNDSSVITTAIDSSISSGDIGSRCFPDTQFSHDLCVPYEVANELEWLSRFAEDSFSSEDQMENHHLISGFKPRHDEGSETHQFEQETGNRTNNPIFNSDMMVPGKTRTKRSRAAPCNWTSRLLVLSQPSMGPTTTMSSESESSIAPSSTGKKNVKAPTKKKEVHDNESQNGEGRRCLHCATDKTPQWRTGPLGPKTLCNACGVRYKSGRLVPEYRPASSPTFVLAKHSNSHRKVLELRRQKEMQIVNQQPFFHHLNVMFDVSQGDDYLIHQHIGQDYRQLI